MFPDKNSDKKKNNMFFVLENEGIAFDEKEITDDDLDFVMKTDRRDAIVSRFNKILKKL